MDDLSALLQCPRRRVPLRRIARERVGVDDSDPGYAVRRGVIDFLSPRKGEPGFSSDAQDFYEEEGWSEQEDGSFGDTRAFVDTRPGPMTFTSKCMRRLGKYFAKGGRYLLDAGSGPIAHPELLEFGERFEKRVCVDLSRHALEIAQDKLGERGVCLLGDLTNLPLQDDSVDAVTCNHVIYQLPEELQKPAFLELYRVLKPGGVAVVIYWWPHAPLAWRIQRVVGMLRRPTSVPEPVNTPPHNPLPRDWFEQQDWPFDYEYDVFRIVTNLFMKRYVGDDLGGRLLLDGLYALQAAAPRYCGMHGIMPAIIIRK